jgi:hypothetical protein
VGYPCPYVSEPPQLEQYPIFFILEDIDGRAPDMKEFEVHIGEFAPVQEQFVACDSLQVGVVIDAAMRHELQ